MGRQLEYHNSGFRKLKSNVFISNDIIWNETDGSAKITKWVSDYEKACPMGITTSFTPLIGEKKTWHPLYINRYVSIDRLLEDIKHNQITFLSPELWTDPFESIFYNKELEIEDKPIDIRCICTTYDYVYNEEAAWNRASNKEHTVRASYNFSTFCEMLNNVGEKQLCTFYLSVVDYSQSKDNLIKKNANKYTNVGDYIKEMSLKRKGFAYENELRIFAVFGESNFLSKKVVPFELCGVNYKDIIHHITLPPLEPNKDINEVCDYNKLQDAKNLPIRNVLRAYLNGVKIEESRLYTIKK